MNDRSKSSDDKPENSCKLKIAFADALSRLIFFTHSYHVAMSYCQMGYRLTVLYTK